MAKVSKICKKYAKISEKVSNFLNSEEKQPHRLSYIKNLSVPKAAKLLKLNISTAKNIIKIYKKEGRVMNKKMSKTSNENSRREALIENFVP